MTTYAYHDAYLGRFITDSLEARALDDVGVMAGTATFSSLWTERLTILQDYILAALENQGDENDLFGAKLKTYSKQLEIALTQARYAAAVEAETIGFGLFGIPMERG